MSDEDAEALRNMSASLERAMLEWNGSVKPRADHLLLIGNATVELARLVLYAF